MTYEEQKQLMELLEKQQDELCKTYYHKGEGESCYIQRVPYNITNIAPDCVEWCPSDDEGGGCIIKHLLRELFGE